MELPYDPAILILGLYAREMKTYVHIKMCIWMFMAALFKTAKTSGNIPSVYEWMNEWMGKQNAAHIYSGMLPSH